MGYRGYWGKKSFGIQRELGETDLWDTGRTGGKRAFAYRENWWKRVLGYREYKGKRALGYRENWGARVFLQIVPRKYSFFRSL